MDKKNKLTVDMVTKIAILAALSVVLRRFFTITIPVNQKIGLGYMPIMLSGILFGPLVGGLTGAMADVVGMLLNPDGMFHPGFTLSAFIMGFSSGLISFNIFKRNFNKHLIIISILSCLVTFMVCRLLLESVFLQQFSKNPYWVYVARRIPKQLIETVLNTVLLIVLVPRLDKYASKKLLT